MIQQSFSDECSPSEFTFGFKDERAWKRVSNINYNHNDYKQLLDEVFVLSGIIKVEVSVISRSRRLRLITLTETLIIPDITKTESNNCFIIHCFEEKTYLLTFLLLTFLLHCPPFLLNNQ